MGAPYCLNIATISDIHLGHPRVKTVDIIARLDAAFPSNTATAELDIIFIAGDLFDQVLNLPEGQVTDIHMWMYRLLATCKKRNIKLRVMEGTPSHDRGQSVLFETVNTLSGIGADCKYINTVTVEHIEDLNIQVLYVPDEWRHDPDDTWVDVQEALRIAGVEKVDYGIMHGVFEHQLPRHLKLPSHMSSRYLSIVRKYISIGHHHTMTVMDRVLAQGSFDRLKHGEEEAKGYFRITSRSRTDNKQDTVVFVENKDATTFKTINLVGLDEEAVTSRLNEVVQLRPFSFIRIIIEKFSPHMATVDSYIKAKSEFTWTIDTAGSEDSKVIRPIEFNPATISASIVKDDIVGIMSDRLKAKGMDASFIKRAISQLETLR